MWQGSVVAIHITTAAGQPMDSVPEARAIAGRGLEGDRYFAGTGYYSDKPSEGGRELTLIETETLEALSALGLTHHGAMAPLVHRGRLRAQILDDGLIRVGDTITPF